MTQAPTRIAAAKVAAVKALAARIKASYALPPNPMSAQQLRLRADRAMFARAPEEDGQP